MPPLGPASARIFRITHIRNVPWILEHGLHCRSSMTVDQNFIPIGLPELIDKRSGHPVPISPGGTLADYVPFYFTPKSIMLLNIKTGYNGVIKRQIAGIAILVSSLHKLAEIDAHFVFTNGHAYMQESEYFSDLSALDKIDWDLLRRVDFKRNPDDPGKVGRYQAEALVHRHVPVKALVGVACYDASAAASLASEVLVGV